MVYYSVMTLLVGTFFLLISLGWLKEHGSTAELVRPIDGLLPTLLPNPFLARRSVLISKSQRTSGDKGYALPMVLIASAVFLLYAGESAARVTREVRVTVVKQNAEMAFYAAEAGFNRVRARVIKRATNGQVTALHAHVETLSFQSGESGGAYQLTITETAPNTYYVVSEGVYGEGPFAARRVVSGTITRGGLKANGDYYVTTTYDP